MMASKVLALLGIPAAAAAAGAVAELAGGIDLMQLAAEAPMLVMLYLALDRRIRPLERRVSAIDFNTSDGQVEAFKDGVREGRRAERDEPFAVSVPDAPHGKPSGGAGKGSRAHRRKRGR